MRTAYLKEFLLFAQCWLMEEGKREREGEGEQYTGDFNEAFRGQSPEAASMKATTVQ